MTRTLLIAMLLVCAGNSAPLRWQLPTTDLHDFMTVTGRLEGWFDYDVANGTYSNWRFVFTNLVPMTPMQVTPVQTVFTPQASSTLNGGDFSFYLNSGAAFQMNVRYGTSDGTWWSYQQLTPESRSAPVGIFVHEFSQWTAWVHSSFSATYLITYTTFRNTLAYATVTAVPEPVPGAMILVSATVLCFLRRRRRPQSR